MALVGPDVPFSIIACMVVGSVCVPLLLHVRAVRCVWWRFECIDEWLLMVRHDFRTHGTVLVTRGPPAAAAAPATCSTVLRPFKGAPAREHTLGQ